MRQVVTWLNEEEYKRFLRHMEKRKTSPYRFLKDYILTSMESPEEYRRKMSAIYFFTLYSLFVATLVLIL